MPKKKATKRPKRSVQNKSRPASAGRRKKIEVKKTQSKKPRKRPSGGQRPSNRKVSATKVLRKRSDKSDKIAYQINQNFSLYKELHSLLVKAVPEAFPSIEKEIKKLGRIKLVILTGTFLNLKGARVDMLVVGEGIQLSKFTEFIKELEAESGKELRYVILSKDEFIYRYEMFDRFLGDILDYPHQKIINKIKV